MRWVLFLFGLIVLLYAFGMSREIENVMQQIYVALHFLIAVILIGSASIVDALVRNGELLKKSLPEKPRESAPAPEG